MLRTVSYLCVPNFDSLPSSVLKLWPIIHFPQVSPLALGLKLLEKQISPKIFYYLMTAENF